MKKEVVIATKNEKKYKEIKRLFKDSKIGVLYLKKFSGIPRIVEDGKTFKENAVKKALIVSRLTDKLVLADDSGLEVASLGGRPGVFSSRYAEGKKSDRLNNLKLLRVLKDRPLSKRKAQFRCVIAIAERGMLVEVVEGVCRGKIGLNMEGKFGFGYDPLFIPWGYKKSFARLGAKLKDRLSHRAKALKRAKRIIEAHLSRAL